MDKVQILSLVVALCLGAFIRGREEKKKRKVLLKELYSLQGEVRVYRRAAMHELVGTEIRDLLDLVFYQEEKEAGNFKSLWERTNEKVRAAFNEWEERDKKFAVPIP